MNFPTWEDYGGSGINSLKLNIGGFIVYFSYKTPIAYDDGEGPVVRQNEWNVTTGRHMNKIDGGAKKGRIPGDIFERKLAAAAERV